MRGARGLVFAVEALLAAAVACTASTENSAPEGVEGGPETGTCSNCPEASFSPPDVAMPAGPDATALRDGESGPESGQDDAPIEAAQDIPADGAIPDGASEASDGATGVADAGNQSFCGSASCPAGFNTCKDVRYAAGKCASPADPAVGCGSSTCQPCQLPHAVARCSGSVCAVAQCEDGWADCNGRPDDGCEASLDSPDSCGDCAVRCTTPSSLCTPTGCASSCTPPLTQCTDRCVNLETDPQVCGGCSSNCDALPNAAPFPTCSSGSCNNPGATWCQNQDIWTDTRNDPNNCGSCGNACAPNSGFVSCASSTCTRTCQAGWTLCGGSSAAGYCTMTGTDPSNCGSCGHACATDQICVASACADRTAIWLASGIPTTQNLALDGAYTYWTDANSAVFRISLTGGVPQAIAQGQAKPWGLAVEGGYVYWSNELGGTIMRAPSDGSGSPQVVATATNPTDIALYQGNVYWIDPNKDGNVWQASETGGTATIAVTPTDPTGGYTGGTLRLIGSPVGPFVSNYTSPNWFVTSVLGNWTSAFGIGSGGAVPDIAQDGVDLYYGVSSGCSIGAFNLASGQSAGCVFGPLDAVLPLAANGCGIVYGDQHGHFALARRGVTYGVPLLDAAVDRAIIAGDFVYFHSTSDNAIGRLPMP